LGSRALCWGQVLLIGRNSRIGRVHTRLQSRTKQKGPSVCTPARNWAIDIVSEAIRKEFRGENAPVLARIEENSAVATVMVTMMPDLAERHNVARWKHASDVGFQP